MTWFKIDDGFYDHPKFLELSNGAVGLWTKAGSWCGKHLTDGVIPASKVRTLKGTAAQVKALVSAQLWVETETDSGAKAYRFHDWNDYQPTRKEKLKERADSTERKRKSRARKAHEQQEQENVTRDSHVTPPRDNRVSHVQASQRPDPTRPDPTYKEREVGGPLTAARETDPTPFPEQSQDDRITEALAAYAADRDHDAALAPPTIETQTAPSEATGSTPDEWCTAGDPRCRTHAYWDRDQVPACRQCANVRAWFEDQDRQAIAEHRQAVEGCSWCDDRGLVATHTADGRPIALQCDHSGPPPEIPADEGHRELSSREKRRHLITQALGRPPETHENDPQGDEHPTPGAEPQPRNYEPANQHTEPQRKTA